MILVITVVHVLLCLHLAYTVFDRAQLMSDAVYTSIRAVFWLLGCAAHYLGKELTDERPTDPVARFHLGNGARVERIHWGADLSPKGMRQSHGLMVNYLYDLRKLDRHREMMTQGKIPVSGDVESLYF